MPDEHLTSLGKHLATLPIEPTIGKALIYAALLRYNHPTHQPPQKTQIAHSEAWPFSRRSSDSCAVASAGAWTPC